MSIQIKRLSAPKISKNGESVKFTAHTTKGAPLSAIFPVSEIESMVESLIGLITSAKISGAAAAHGKETYGTKDENGWSDVPIVVLVENFQTIDNPDTGGFFLRLQDIHGRVIDNSFRSDHVQALKKMIDEYEDPNRATRVH